MIAKYLHAPWEHMKRVNLTLPEPVFEDLELWAQTRGQAIATLAAIIIEIALRQAKAEGEIPLHKREAHKKPAPERAGSEL